MIYFCSLSSHYKISKIMHFYDTRPKYFFSPIESKKNNSIIIIFFFKNHPLIEDVKNGSTLYNIGCKVTTRKPKPQQIL